MGDARPTTAASRTPGVAVAADHPDHPAARPPMLGSLRARLIVSHAVVILLALALVLAISTASLRRYEREAQVDELLDLAVPLAVEARLLLTAPRLRDTATRERVTTLLSYQAAETGVRILVLGPEAEVLVDTAATNPLVGQAIAGYASSVNRLLGVAQGSQRVVRTVVSPSEGASDPFADQIVVLAAGGRAIAGQPLPEPGALMLVGPPRRQGVTGRFLPPLLIILAIALAVAAAAGYLLSRRIAAPLARLTAAADAMAAGDLDQRIPDQGQDELGRLVASFNAMSYQIATTARSQRTLLADIAHELRTPLTSVQGYAQALRDGVLPDETERDRALATIGAESDRMARLIRQLLELSRLESGQTALVLRPVDLGPVLARVQARFRPEAERRGVVLLITVAPGSVALADEERLGQILDNLVGNALRHTPTGGEVVLAAAPPSPPDASGQSRVRLTVRDSGEGIAAERLPRIFDRFTRGEGRAGRDGFGLGLAIVRELVLTHGGTIAVASEPGRGTTFTVELPAAPAAP